MMPGFADSFKDDPDLFMTTFGEYAVGAQPADWTSRHVAGGFTAVVQSVAGSKSGKALRWTKSAANRQSLSWDKVPPVADVEGLVRARRITTGVNNDNLIGIMLRGGGGAGTEAGYRQCASNLNTNQLWQHTTNKYVAGTSTTVGATYSPLGTNMADNLWFWLRFRLIGTSLQRRAWMDGVTEPGAWDLTDTDSSVSAAGWVGLSQVTATPNVEIDFFGVALNGKTVPMLF